MLDELKYEKQGNIEILNKKKTLGIFSTRNFTDYSNQVVKNLIYKFKDNFVFYFTYDFYLRSGVYRIKDINFAKVLVTESKYMHHNLIKNSEAQLVVEEFTINKRLNYLFKDLVILNFVSKILILEATKFSQNLKILAEVASENSIEVYCLPGKLTDYSSYGTNKIIYDGGIPLFDFELLSG